jgi:hypothetical protein
VTKNVLKLAGASDDLRNTSEVSDEEIKAVLGSLGSTLKSAFTIDILSGYREALTSMAENERRQRENRSFLLKMLREKKPKKICPYGEQFDCKSVGLISSETRNRRKPTYPYLSKKSKPVKFDRDAKFVLEGCKSVISGEVATAHAAAIELLLTHGRAKKGGAIAKGKIIASSDEAAITRLQKKISKALKLKGNMPTNSKIV